MHRSTISIPVREKSVNIQIVTTKVEGMNGLGETRNRKI